MADDAGSDRPEDERRSDPRPSQRIRIVGAENASGDAPGSEPDAETEADTPAEEAEAPAEGAEAPTSGADDPNRFGAVPVVSPDEPPPAGAGPTDPEATQVVPPVAGDTGETGSDAGADDLPHWTAPPTGQVPAVEDDDDLDVWAGLSTGPQWKGEGEEEDVAEQSGDIEEETSVVPQPDDEPVTVRIDDLGAKQPEATTAPGGPPQRPAETPTSGPEDLYPPQVEQPVPAATAGGGGDRDMQQAVLVGVGLVVVAFVCFFIGPAATVLLATVLITLAAAEFYSAVKRAGYHPVPLIGLVATPGLMLAAYWRGEAAIPLVLFLTVVTCLLWWLMDLSTDRAVPNIGITLFGVLYVGLLGSFAALLLKFPDGIGMLFGAILATVAYDVGGLFIGQRFGSTRLGPASPNKTMEGLLGGGVSAVVVSVVVLGVIGVFPWEFGDAFALGIGVAIAAPLGDLCESRIKRDLGIKDMGDILPGHGGILDRFDALLFVLPTTFYVVRALEVWANVPS